MSETIEKQPSVSMGQSFRITGVSRADIVCMLMDNKNLNEEKAVEIAMGIDDYTMRILANQMAEAYIGQCFWDHLNIFTIDLIAELEDK